MARFFLFVYACVCVRTFLWQMRTLICIMTQVWQRYYKVKVTFQDIAHVPTFQNAYRSYRVSFLGGGSRNAQSPVRARFRCRVRVGQYHIQFVQYKNSYAYGMSPLFTKTNVCVCVCVCVRACMREWTVQNYPLQRKAAPYEFLNTENLLTLAENPVHNTHTHTHRQPYLTF